MTDPSVIIVGAERDRVLREFGFPPGLLEAIANPSADPITSIVITHDGVVLAEIATLPGVDGALPPGRIVPVCHVEESQLVYILLVERDERWTLVHWMPESTEAISGGIEGYLTDMIVDVWESELFSDDELIAWGERIGHPASARLVRELAVVDRPTLEAFEKWRASFLASLG